jgi:hypothetical protein
MGVPSSSCTWAWVYLFLFFKRVNILSSASIFLKKKIHKRHAKADDMSLANSDSFLLKKSILNHFNPKTP